jgi:hypothetical protein
MPAMPTSPFWSVATWTLRMNVDVTLTGAVDVIPPSME